MKLDLGETFEEKKERLSQWHRWYAWRPVRVGSHDYRWLEYVERRGKYWDYADIWLWSYREYANNQ